MKPMTRKYFALLGGIALGFLFEFWVYWFAAATEGCVSRDVGLPSDHKRGDAAYAMYASTYAKSFAIGLSAAAGLSFALLAWERRPPQLRIQVVYWLLLCLVLPMSISNYATGDYYISRSQQSLLNIIAAFLGAVCAINLAKISSETVTGGVLKVMALFFLLFQGVMIPLLFSIVWWMNWTGLLATEGNDNWISADWLSAIAAVAAALVSTLQYLSSKKSNKGAE